MTVQQHLLTNFFRPKSARKKDDEGSHKEPDRSHHASREQAQLHEKPSKCPVSTEHNPPKMDHAVDFRFGGFSSVHRPTVNRDSSLHEKFEKHFTGSSQKRSDPFNSDTLSKKKHNFKLTPLEQQIIELKRQNMDKILAIQVGYKYKFFGNDAQIASKILNIMYIPGRVSINVENASEEENLYNRFAYCSIPDTRLHVHLKRLLHRGLKVGVVEQKETAIMKQNAGTGSKLFERKVTKVYTSGTYIDDNDLSNGGKSIVCIQEGVDANHWVSLVAVNTYRAEITYDEFSDDYTCSGIETRLLHLEPIEIITVGQLSKEARCCIDGFRRSLRTDSDQLRLIKVLPKTTNEYVGELDQFSFNEDVISFITRQKPALLSCFCELMLYLHDFELSSVFKLLLYYRHFSEVDNSMVLDSNTIKNLEIFHNVTTGTEKGSLFWILNHTNTPFGKKMLRSWIARPLNDREHILERSGAIQTINDHYTSIPVERVLRLLKYCPDLEVSLSKLHYGRSKRKDVYLFLRKMDEIFEVFERIRPELVHDAFESHYLIEIYQHIKNTVSSDLKEFRKLFGMIYSPAAMDEQDEEGHVMKYFNESFYHYDVIQEQRSHIKDIENLLDEELNKTAQVLKRPHLKYVTNNKEPYLIEVRNKAVKSVPVTWLKINGTKSVSRFRSPEITELYEKWLYYKECLRQQCNQCFREFVTKIDYYFLSLNTVIKQLATLDCLFSLASASSVTGDYSKPELVDKPMVKLINARNPISETLKSTYISNDFTACDDKNRVSIITGPNMGGKSSFIRQIALIVIMAQIGCYIPADRSSKLGIFDSIYIRIGAYDDIFKGQSTFQVEMSECSTILSKCTERSLVLLDEIGRGTSSVDGCAIAYSILDYLCFDKKPFVLFITHFQNLQVFENLTHGAAKNYHLGFQKHDDDLVFTYKFVEGPSARSYGVYCAKLAGLPDDVTENALKVSRVLEKKWICSRTRSMAKSIRDVLSSNGQGLADIWQAVAEFE
ncbi:hypothetical protein FOA43_003883 [Brettanomyces nanus]|uniref:DNA mismatch repair protein MSH3 n=1 Tax=Eeniella nana TaxID=13502 RepID=A0A875SCH6_EENNA|nr:uncharacterized protein FOA43_003883 [Brettanomyces nanus]QPG76494.1 hypothetical protein FOA43_003883 [Brettanomyces nanus]